jgi:tetratricopeptide (TPR) repeat protein
MSIFDEIREHKSRYEFEGAWQAGFKALEVEPSNEFLKFSLFWVIYAALKPLLDPVKARENKVPLPCERAKIDFWVSRICTLQLALPSENIDFRLWNLFGETGKFCEPLCTFILNSGSKLFTPSDHQPFVSDKSEFPSPSVVMKLARMVAAGFLVKGASSPLPANRVTGFLKYAAIHAKDSPEHKVWLEWDKARIYFTVGQFSRARDSYLAVLKKKRREPWVWFGLAKTYADEPEKAICLIASGLTYAHDPKFRITGLGALAERLAETGAYENASKALVKLMAIYTQDGWTPKDNIVKLTSYSWYDAAIGTNDLDAVVKRLAENASLYTISKPDYLQGVLQSVYASNKRANIYIARDLVISAGKAVFLGRQIPPPGTFVKVLCDMEAQEKEVIAAEIVQDFSSADIRAFSGPLTVSEKGFGFVNREIFVPAALISGIQPDAQVAGTAVMSFDKVKNKYGWKAVVVDNEQ